MINTSIVSVNARNKVMSTEISSFPGKSFERIWPDSCDMGITMVSTKTGKTSQWFISENLQYGEELAGWELIPTTETLRKLPELHGWKLVVFND